MRRQEFIALGSALVALGIVFSEDWLIGYSFIGAGVLLSIIGGFTLRRKSKTQSQIGGGV